MMWLPERENTVRAPARRSASASASAPRVASAIACVSSASGARGPWGDLAAPARAGSLPPRKGGERMEAATAAEPLTVGAGGPPAPDRLARGEGGGVVSAAAGGASRGRAARADAGALRPAAPTEEHGGGDGGALLARGLLLLLDLI